MALTFDDVSLKPRHSAVLPNEVDVSTRLTRNMALNVPLVSAGVDAADPQHGPERAAGQRRDGHRHGVPHGDRHGPARRSRGHSQEPRRRRAGFRGGPGETFRERDDRRPDYARSPQQRLPGAGPDEEVPDLGRTDHRGRQERGAARRHPHESRPPLPRGRAAPDLGSHDARAPHNRPGRHDAGSGSGDPAPAPASRSCSSSTRTSTSAA